MERNELNSNEKIAMMHDGIEGNGKHFVMNGESADTLIQREKQTKYNEQVGEYVKKFESHNQALEDYAKNLSKTINDLEIVPMYSYVLIKPFEHNIFQQMRIEKSGLISDLGGYAPQYKSNETGQTEEEEQYIKVGTVIETGHTTQFVKVGDVVMYPVASVCPVPFFKQGFITVDEHRIIAVVNSGLTDRKKDIRNGK